MSRPPDAELHVRMTEARVERCRPEQRWRGTATQRGPMQRYAMRQLFDVKTIHGGNPDYRAARASGEDGQSGAVAPLTDTSPFTRTPDADADTCGLSYV